MTWYDSGMPVINDPDVLATAELIRRLYDMPGCDMGGPLHAMLDDGNIDDEQINGDYYERTDGRTIETYLCRHRMEKGPGTTWNHVYDDELHPPEGVADLCRLILASFRRMPEPWRAAAIAWHDGTIARNLLTLVNSPEAARKASDEQVDDLVADLRRWIERGEIPGPRACVPIPCPPFTPTIQNIEQSPDVPEWQREAYSHIGAVGRDLLVGGESRVRYEQSIDRPGLRVTRLDGHGQPVGEPVEVSGWADVGILADEPDPEHPKPQIRWVEQTIKIPFDSVDPELWHLLHGGDPLRVSVADAQNEPPRVDMPPTWAETVAQYIPLMYTVSDPGVEPPVFVQVPEGTDADGMSAAIELCKRAGLLNTPGGYVLLPAELDLS